MKTCKCSSRGTISTPANLNGSMTVQRWDVSATGCFGDGGHKCFIWKSVFEILKGYTSYKGCLLTLTLILNPNAKPKCRTF